KPATMDSLIVYSHLTGKTRMVSGAVCTGIKVHSTGGSFFSKIKDTLTGRNLFNIYPNPVSRGSFVNIDMKNVKPGEYSLQLFDMEAKMINQQLISLPTDTFIFHFDISN